MYFRYPYWATVSKGNKPEFEEFLKSINLTNLFWDIDTNDWRSTTTTIDVKNQILKSKENKVILVHDKKKTLDALRLI